MSDWDDDDFEVPALVAQPKDAPETWSDEEGHDVKKAEPEPAAPAKKPEDDFVALPVPAPPPKPKQLAKQKLAEREAKEREMEAKAKAAAAKAKASVVFGDDRGLLDGARGADAGADPVSEKARLRQLEEEADFENTQGLFGNLALAKKKNDVPGGETIDAFVARTKDDGEALAEKVASKLLQFENTPFFLDMVKSLNKKLTVPLQSEDVKDLASTVQVVANDKLKAEREKQKGKKKPTKANSKAAVKEVHNSAFDNTDEYGGYDDDYDFM